MKNKITILISVMIIGGVSLPQNAEAFDWGDAGDLLTSGQSLNLDGILGGLLDFGGIPGLGNINANCNTPNFDIPSLDLCSITKGIDIPSLPSLDFSIAGCTLQTGYENTISSCQKEILDLGCGDNNVKVNMDDYVNGLGGNNVASSKYMALMGGKGVFGENLCSDDPKRYEKMNSAPSTTTYGPNGWAKRALFDKTIGGDPVNMNKRRTAKMLSCVELALETGQSTDICALNNPDVGSDKTPSEIEDSIYKSAKYDMGTLSDKTEGKLEDKVDKYWKLFYEKAQARGVSDWKLLMAIGMHESGLDPTYDSAPIADGSRDYGMMQINSSHKEKINEWYGSYGGFWQALHIPEPSVDYAAYILSQCGGGWAGVMCYGGGSIGYLVKVQQEYMKLSARDFGTPDQPYVEDVKISQRTSANAALSFIAVQNRHTMTHLGQDTVDLLPVDKKGRYIQMVNRHMAQKTLILAAYKKASDIEKTLYHTNDYSGAVSSGGQGLLPAGLGDLGGLGSSISSGISNITSGFGF